MPRPLSAEAREKAIAAAQELVAIDGIAGFGIDAVARRSGVAKTTLYRHWESANELLVEALCVHIPELTTPNTGSLRSDLTAILAQAGPLFEDESLRRMMLDLLAAASRDPDLNLVHQQMHEERHRPIATVLELAMARGEIPTMDIALAVDLVEGPFMTRMLLRDSESSPDDLTTMLDFALRGLGAG